MTVKQNTLSVVLVLFGVALTSLTIMVAQIYVFLIMPMGETNYYDKPSFPDVCYNFTELMVSDLDLIDECELYINSLKVKPNV